MLPPLLRASSADAIAIDLDMLRGLRLSAKPRAQILIGHTLLRASYRIPRRAEIVIEGTENVPKDRTVFFAMNHTDRYNYWPFQYGMWKRKMRYTATWVKGKYFENPWMRRFMIATNNIPLPSRGYVISTGFRDAEKRAPDAAEYRVLRDLADGVASDAEVAKSTDAVKRFVAGGGLPRFEETFRFMMGELVRLNRDALFKLGLDVLVFPEGTRSIRLAKGHTGLAQMSQSLGVDIVPVGCNGSHRLYPGGSPWASGGRVIYRIGKVLALDGPELGLLRVKDVFEPMVPSATRAHGEQFRRITDIVMARIEALLDEEHRPGAESGGSKDMDRFL